MADLFKTFVDFWLDVLLLVPRLIFWSALELLEMAIAFLATAFPADPATFSTVLPPDVLYFLTMFQFHTGLSMMVAALVGRFILRRIPFIG